MIEDNDLICQNNVIEQSIQPGSVNVNATNGVMNLTIAGSLDNQHTKFYKLKKEYIHIDEILGVSSDLNIDMSTVTDMKSLLSKL